MPESPQVNPETAVDDVRRVREAIDRQHAGDLRAHVEETRRIAAALRDRLRIKTVPSPTPPPQRVGG